MVIYKTLKRVVAIYCNVISSVTFFKYFYRKAFQVNFGAVAFGAVSCVVSTPALVAVAAVVVVGGIAYLQYNRCQSK